MVVTAVVGSCAVAEGTSPPSRSLGSSPNVASAPPATRGLDTPLLIQPGRPYAQESLQATELVTTSVTQAGIGRGLELLAASLATADGATYQRLRIELTCYSASLCEAAVSGQLAGSRRADEWLFASKGQFLESLVAVAAGTRLHSVPRATTAALVQLVTSEPGAALALNGYDPEPDITWFPQDPMMYELEFRPPSAGGPGDPVEGLTKVVIRIDAMRRQIVSVVEGPIAPS